MPTKPATVLAWLLWSLYVALAACSVLLPLARGSSLVLADVLQPGLTLSYVTVGAWIASRRPRNPIGWLFCLAPILLVLGNLAAAYVANPVPDRLPGSVAMAWLASWTSWLGYAILFTFTFLLFPNGQLPSRAWRPVAWFFVAQIGLGTIARMFQPGPLDAVPSIRNPFGIEAAGGILSALLRFSHTLDVLLMICIASVVFRFRGAPREERQQLKWLAYAATMVLAAWPLSSLLEAQSSIVLKHAGQLLFAIAATTVPIAIGVAVLKYRLYDIDFIINRTLVYGVLSAILVVVYFTSVFLLQAVLRAFLGQTSQVTTVAATLLAAAVSGLLRRRIQNFIDRRFYRRKYNAQQVLTSLAATLRNHTDLDQLTDTLLTVVQETFQPVSLSFWLREPSSKRGEPSVSQWVRHGRPII